MSAYTSQLPFARTPPHGPLRRFFGQRIGQLSPVEWRMYWPHMRQSQIASLRGFSMASTSRSTARTVLPLLQRLIDELDGLGERRILRGLRGADDLLGHAGSDRGIG